MMGQNVKAGPVHQQVLAKSDHGTVRIISPIDGQDRLASARTLRNFPISVVATTTIASALADWREQIRFLIPVGGLSALARRTLPFFFVLTLSQQQRF